MTTAHGEAARKAIHAGLSLLAAGVVWWAPHPLGAAILAGATAVALSVELARGSSRRFASWFRDRLGPMLRDREAVHLTGATTLSIGYTLAAALLPGRPAVAGILITGVADALAAVVGKRWGKHRYPGGKSLEGSAAFMAATFGLAVAIPGIDAVTAAATAAVLAVLEAPTLRVDDNLYLPLVGAGVLRLFAGLWGAAGVGIFS